MPHQCVRCGSMYGDGDKAILTGCTCGARLFFYVRKKHLDESQELVTNLSEKQKENIEKDVAEIIHTKVQDPNKPVVLDFEAIRVLKPGKYELDLVHLFKNDPLIIKLEDGKYMIDLPQAFKN